MESVVAAVLISNQLPKLLRFIWAQKGVQLGIQSLLADLKSMEDVLHKIEAALPADQLDDDMTRHFDDVIRLTYNIEHSVDKFMAPGLWQTRFKQAILCNTLHSKFRSDMRSFQHEIEKLRKWFDANRDAILASIGDLRHTHTVDAGILLPLHVQVKNSLLKKLTHDGQTTKGQLKIASIHGPPGMGKTILAMQVYTELKPKFEITAWVTVATNFEILRNILRQISQEDHESIDQKDIIQAIREALQNKRYFLVIDNISEFKEWESIKCALTEDFNGSAVLTTTDSDVVAGYVGGGHKLESFNARSFFASYNDLSPNTRSCLLYLSLFQKGYEIRVDRLIWEWIAEGFIDEKCRITAQEKGEEYLSKLVEKKFIEVVEVDVVGKAMSCRVHDRMHEVLVACSAQGNFGTILDGWQGSSTPPSLIHRLSIQGNKINPVLKEERLFHVKSLVVSGDGNLLPSLSNFKGLRVFELGGCDSSQDLRGIGSLYRLRCLVMGSTFSSEIQKEIGELVLLQTLDLRATKLKELPQSVFQISQLRCLCVNSRTKIPDGIGKMVNLEELGDINIDKPELLKKLCNLTKLRVLRIAVWSSDERYGKQLIKYLYSLLKKPKVKRKSPRQAIQSLSILTCCSVHFWNKSYNRHTRYLSLPKLEIRHSKFHLVPRWICSIENLSSLSIEVYKISQGIIKMLGDLQHLESLSLTSTSKRSPDPEGRFGKSPGAFSKLTSFRIMSNAMGKIFDQESMPILRRFTLSFEASRTNNLPKAFNFGLKYLPSSLKHVRVEIICSSASTCMVEQAEAAIREAIQRGSSPKAIVENQRILDEHMVEEDEVEQIAKESPYEASIPVLPHTCVRPNANKTDEVRSQITELMIDNIHHQLKLLNHDAKVKDILRDTRLSKDEAHHLVEEARDRVKDLMKQALEVECGPSDKSSIVERLYNLGKSNVQHKQRQPTGGNVCHREGPTAAEAHETSHGDKAVHKFTCSNEAQVKVPRCPLAVTIGEPASASMSVPPSLVASADQSPSRLVFITNTIDGENINQGVKEKALPALEPETHQLKEVIMKRTEMMQIEEAVTKDGDRKPMRRHNKPKKAQDYVVSPQDYACTGKDQSVIERIKSEPNEKRLLVRIDDAFLNKTQLVSLLDPKEFIGDEVINVYIQYISATKHLQVRLGGSVFLENACFSRMIKNGGYLPTNDTMAAPEWLLNRVKMYLEKDMIFIPINIENAHWYLCVINLKKQCVQVLDSLGADKCRKDLMDTLKGLELKSDMWKELNITKWPMEECIKNGLQTDGFSCGLWMLNFMEYFTGDVLSDNPEQVDMTNFRSKLAVILVDSELNAITNQDFEDD